MALLVALLVLSVLSADSLAPTRITHEAQDDLQQLETHLELNYWDDNNMAEPSFDHVSAGEKVRCQLYLYFQVL
jgi:hypothetical protein